jgi:hypothetical protein
MGGTDIVCTIFPIEEYYHEPCEDSNDPAPRANLDGWLHEARDHSCQCRHDPVLRRASDGWEYLLR